MIVEYLSLPSNTVEAMKQIVSEEDEAKFYLIDFIHHHRFSEQSLIFSFAQACSILKIEKFPSHHSFCQSIQDEMWNEYQFDVWFAKSETGNFFFFGVFLLFVFIFNLLFRI